MKKVFFAVVAVLCLGVAWYILTDGTMSLKAARNKLMQDAQEAVVKNANPEDVAALAMKAINMTQGEHGVELWRLKAEWGNMRRSDEIMELEKPRFTYYMPPDNVEVNIASDKGDIDQDEQKVRFLDNVVAIHTDRTVNAPVMVYFGKSREVICPQGAKITGTGLEGTANRVVWRLQDQILEGYGDVDMTFENDKDIFSPRQDPDGEEQRQEGAQG